MSEKMKYGSAADIAQRIREWLGKYGRENTASLLLYEAMQALERDQLTAETRKTWSTDGGYRCLNCGAGLSQHEGQTYCAKFAFARYEAMQEAGRQASAEMLRLEKYLDDTSKPRSSIACASCGDHVSVNPVDEGMDHICDGCSVTPSPERSE